jgi:hypothetical protein
MTWIPVKVPKPKARVSQPRKGLQRRVRMKTHNAKRKGHAFPKRRDPVYADFVRGFPCILAWPLIKGWCDGKRVHWHRCIGKVQFCHIKTRGSGGDDYANAYPGCGAAHEEQHAIGIPEFERRYNLDLRKRAQQLAKLYDTTRTFSGGSSTPQGAK